MTPYTEQILLECKDARVILRHPDGYHFTMVRLAEVGTIPPNAAASGVQIAGSIGLGLDGSIVAAAESRELCEMVQRARLAFVIDQHLSVGKPAGTGDWLESLHKLEDTRQ